jgi:hypothetical protein
MSQVFPALTGMLALQTGPASDVTPASDVPPELVVPPALAVPPVPPVALLPSPLLLLCPQPQIAVAVAMLKMIARFMSRLPRWWVTISDARCNLYARIGSKAFEQSSSASENPAFAGGDGH